MDEVEVYTDGACRGNPGPGGYGTILLSKGRQKSLSQGFRKTTNNRMELWAVIAGLQALTRPCKVTLYSDSKYVVDAMRERWVFKWRAKSWKNKENRDLWEQILALCERHEVTFTWVKGHAGNPLNHRCDELAVAAAKASSLKIDETYEAIVAQRNAQSSLF